VVVPPAPAGAAAWSATPSVSGRPRPPTRALGSPPPPRLGGTHTWAGRPAFTRTALHAPDFTLRLLISDCRLRIQGCEFRPYCAQGIGSPPSPSGGSGTKRDCSFRYRSRRLLYS
jgi:hypothetical protein